MSGNTVRFTLATHEPASLELFDIAGRRLWSTDLSATGPGEHTATLANGAWLPRGLYLIRVTQGDRQIARRFALTR